MRSLLAIQTMKGTLLRLATVSDTASEAPLLMVPTSTSTPSRMTSSLAMLRARSTLNLGVPGGELDFPPQHAVRVDGLQGPV